MVSMVIFIIKEMMFLLKKVIHIMDNYDEALKKTIIGYKSLNRFSKERTLGAIKKILDKI